MNCQKKFFCFHFFNFFFLEKEVLHKDIFRYFSFSIHLSARGGCSGGGREDVVCVFSKVQEEEERVVARVVARV